MDAVVGSSHFDMHGAALQQKPGFDGIQAVEMQMDFGAPNRSTTVIEKKWWKLLLFWCNARMWIPFTVLKVINTVLI